MFNNSVVFLEVAEFPEPLLRFAFVCCVLFIILGIPGNLVTIIALARCRKVSNATAVFIINLQISDLLQCCLILPVTAFTYWKKHWALGEEVCQVYPFFKYILNAVSIFSITAIAINRCILVCHPHVYTRIYKTKNTTIMTLTLWITAIAIFLPVLLKKWGKYGLEPNGFFCTVIPNEEGYSPKILLMVSSFLITCVILIVCYLRILWTVHRTSINVTKNKYPISNVSISKLSNTNERIISRDVETASNSNIEDDDTVSTNASSVTSTQDKTVIDSIQLIKPRNRLSLPSKRDKRLYTMVVAIMLSFCVCHMPLMITKLLCREYRKLPTANIVTHLLEFGATCINPIVYVLISKEYRQTYLRLYKWVQQLFYNKA